MGALVEIVSEDFLLPRAKFALALRALRALAKKRPDDFLEPNAVVEAQDLEEALVNASFAYDTNAKGDIVSLRYGADKAVQGAGDDWFDAFCRALAPSVKSGAMSIAYDDDPAEVHRFKGGKVSRSKAKAKAKKVAALPKAKKSSAAKFTPLPEDSAGIRWTISLHFVAGHGWQRKRLRVEKALRVLAGTAWWSEVETLVEIDKPAPLAVAPKGKPLALADVLPKIANGQDNARAFLREDGEVSIELDVASWSLDLVLYARDGALARLGDAAYAGVGDLVARLVEALGDEIWVSGVGMVKAARAIDREDASRIAVPKRWPSDAFAIIVDERISEDEDDDLRAETKALVAARASKPAIVHEAGPVKMIRWPVVPGDSASVRAAARAYDAWLGDRVARVAWKVSRQPAPPAKPVKRPAKARVSDADLEHYSAYAQSELTFHDRPMWHGDEARVRFIVERLSRTALWPLVTSDARAVESTIAAIAKGRGETILKSKDAKLALEHVWSMLTISFDLKASALAQIGKVLVGDFLALVSDLRTALRGRAVIERTRIRPSGLEDDAPMAEQPDDEKGFGINDWPVGDAVALMFDPQPTEDARWFERVAATRIMAQSPLPPEGKRVERDGLVVVTFADDLSDPLRTVDARRACSFWQAWVKSHV